MASTELDASVCVREGAPKADAVADTPADAAVHDVRGDDDDSGGTCTADADCVPGAPCLEAECVQSGATRRCQERPVDDSTSCDDGDPCTRADQCSAGQCVGGPHPCADMPACFSCDLAACQTVLLPGYCYIDGACVAENQPHPSNPCQRCQPDGGAADFVWSGCPSGVSCSTPSSCQCQVAQDMVAIPGGSLWLGCDAVVDGTCRASELPLHHVTLSPFFLDRFEVSVNDFQCCVDAGACTAPGGGGQCNWGVVDRALHPVNCVTWAQAAGYCAWLGKRLPTEAEWERAGGDDVFPWGSAPPDCVHAVMSYDAGTGCGTNATFPVGSKSAGAGPFGNADLGGNVAEWVADWFDTYPGNPQIDPVGPASGTRKVVRGGSFDDGTDARRVAARGARTADEAAFTTGFRCAF